nr:hypothetical protein [uncultured Marinifilum sp.]
MNFNLIRYKRTIDRIEDLTNKIFDTLMFMDERDAESNGLIIQKGTIEKVSVLMNELLWDNYWKISKISGEAYIRYKGFGKAEIINDALLHLLVLWYDVINKKLGYDILSNNWINFGLHHDKIKFYD